MDDNSKKIDKALLALNDEKLVTIQRNTMEAEVDAALAMKSEGETKTLAEKLPEEMQAELKNLAFVARAIGELGTNAANARAVQTLIMNGLMNNQHPAEILSALVELFAYQETRILKALESQKEGSVVKPMKIVTFKEFMADFIPQHKDSIENKAIAKELKSASATKAFSVEEMLNKASNKASQSKTTEYTNPDVEVEELMKRVTPGSKAMN